MLRQNLSQNIKTVSFWQASITGDIGTWNLQWCSDIYNPLNRTYWASIKNGKNPEYDEPNPHWCDCSKRNYMIPNVRNSFDSCYLALLNKKKWFWRLGSSSRILVLIQCVPISKITCFHPVTPKIENISNSGMGSSPLCII